MSMISEFVEKLVDRLEELRKSESDREDYSDNHDIMKIGNMLLKMEQATVDIMLM